VRILLDENLPVDLAAELTGREAASVAQLGWQGIKNSELLRRAQGRFEVLLTMDSNLEFQQDIAASEVAILVLVARSNRMAHLRPLVPSMLIALESVRPGELRKVSI
jgi:predicted nuclease of predicted toxin-antitoxin system